MTTRSWVTSCLRIARSLERNADLPVIAKDGWDGCTPVTLDLDVGVSCRPAQALSKSAGNARLARATETDQDDPIDVAHIPLETGLRIFAADQYSQRWGAACRVSARKWLDGNRELYSRP